jgi:hypothetical protein
VRDRREIDIRFVLGRNELNGTGGVPKHPFAARYWLQIAAADCNGYRPGTSPPHISMSFVDHNQPKTVTQSSFRVPDHSRP